MAEAILRFPAVQGRVSLSRTQIYELIARGDFPRQFKLSERASGWLASEVDAWIEQRIAESREKVAA